jgi:hypothetical protein
VKIVGVGAATIKWHFLLQLQSQLEENEPQSLGVVHATPSTATQVPLVPHLLVGLHWIFEEQAEPSAT